MLSFQTFSHRWIPLRTLLAEPIPGASLLIRISFQPYTQIITETGEVLTRESGKSSRHVSGSSIPDYSSDDQSNNFEKVDSSIRKSSTSALSSVSSVVRRASQQSVQLVPSLLRRRSSLASHKAESPVGLSVHYEEDEIKSDKNNNLDTNSISTQSNCENSTIPMTRPLSVSQTSNSHGAYGMNSTSAVAASSSSGFSSVLPINPALFSGINFHGLLPQEAKTTVSGYNGFGMVTTGGEYPAFDYIVESPETFQVIKNLNNLIMDFRASLSLIRQTVGYTSDYEYTLSTSNQGDVIATICTKLSDYNRSKSKISQNSNSYLQFRCLVQFPPDNSNVQVPCLLISGNHPSHGCKQLCERIEEALLRSMRNIILQKSDLERKLIDILMKMKDVAMCDSKGEVFGENDENGAYKDNFSYAVRKTLTWNIIYISSLIVKVQNLQRDVLVLLKRFKSYCKLVNIYCDGQVDNALLSPTRSNFVKSASVQRSESTAVRKIKNDKKKTRKTVKRSQSARVKRR